MLQMGFLSVAGYLALPCQVLQRDFLLVGQWVMKHMSSLEVTMSEVESRDLEFYPMVEKDNKEAINRPSSNVVDRDPLEGKNEEEDSDTETTNDSLSSHGGSQIADDDKTERASRVPKKLVNKRNMHNVIIT
ncbi:hypothetical protein POM88_005098 [Heracleum sosnowskyi]|uniref:Uncharacterized protein n=1 Tax=Heracleum sosnowskyi TaxID=360622 RepID=A0AAD8JLJ6_9APIA|nr:hypothetical protein POM88_005098 [Heracleum sosnowskyi]